MGRGVRRKWSPQLEVEALFARSEEDSGSGPPGHDEATGRLNAFMSLFPLGRNEGLYGCRLTIANDAWAIYAVGTRKALAALPSEFEGLRVVKNPRRRPDRRAELLGAL